MKKKVIILGGGISGLSLAYYLSKQKKHFDIQLIEKKESLGGWIDSTHFSGFFFEKGPRLLRGKEGEALFSLITELGLKNEIVFPNPKERGRYLWAEGRLRKMSLLSWSLIKGALKERFIKPLQEGDESVWEFACRRFNRMIAQEVFDPLVVGMCGGDAKEISMKLAFPRLKKLETEYGSLLRGFYKTGYFSFPNPSTFSLKEGIKTVIEKLEKETDIPFHYNEEVVSIHPKKEGFEVRSLKKTYESDYLFSALPCSEIGKLFIPQLLDIPIRGTTVLHFAYQRNVLKGKGFGYLVPSVEKENLLGVIFDSNLFPQHNTSSSEEARATIFLNGHPFSDEEAYYFSLRALERHLKITDQPVVSKILKMENSFPQLCVGHEEFMKRILKGIEEKYPHFYLVGNYLYGIGVGDCVERAKSVANSFLMEIAS